MPKMIAIAISTNEKFSEIKKCSKTMTKKKKSFQNFKFEFLMERIGIGETGKHF